MKFKVGDRVINIKNLGNSEYDKYLNKEGVIVGERYDFTFPYVVEFSSNLEKNYFKEEELKLVQQKQKQFTKADLKERYIVKTRDGKESIVNLVKRKIYELKDGIQLENHILLADYNNDLTIKYPNGDFDIIEVYKPKYETIWTREEEIIKEINVQDLVNYYEQNNNCKIKITESKGK